MKNTILLSLAIATISFASFSQNIGIGTTTPNSALDVLSSAATSTNATIYGTNNGTTGSGIYGISNSIGTYGVRGISNTGTAVQGYTNGGYALLSNAASGTAIHAQSISGYGLYSSGKLRFSGGNTNPTDGALLTSDATGNATWKRSNLAFYANSAVNSAITNTPIKVEFNNEVYDTQNNFVDYAGAPTTGSSVFTAPVAGVYHFSSSILIEKSGLEQYDLYLRNGIIRLMINGTLESTITGFAIQHQNASSTYSDYVYLYIDLDVHLNANDKVWIEAGLDHYSSALSAPLNAFSYNGRFNGELVFED